MSATSTSSTSSTPSVTKQWTLAKEDELRLEIDTAHACIVTLLSGTAELFGCELALDHDYTLEAGTKTAIFTWSGCELRIRGTPKSGYIANETPMISYINTHAALETLRNKAREASKTSISTPTSSSTSTPDSKPAQGPRVLIVGPMDAGKSTLARILLNYAVRAGSHPTYVDLDVGQNAITIPGAVAATSVEHPIGVSTSDSLIIRAPLVYYYGHTTPSTSQELYQKLVERLAAVVEKRLEKNEEARHSGLIINTCGWIDNSGYDLIVHATTTFHIDVILVVGHERLYSDLKADTRLNDASVIKLSKSGGVVSRDLTARRASRMRSIKEYFYGIASDLHPHQKVLRFNDVEIYRVGGGPQAPNTALPIGTKRLLDPNRVAKFTPTQELQHTMLAVPYTTDATQLLESNVAGFIYVTNVDIQKKHITCLTPAPGDLPSNLLLAGSVKWFD